MRHLDVSSSQLLPYPDHPLVKWPFRSPILLYRLGLGLIVGRLFMILTTTGRKSGLPVAGLMLIVAIVLGWLDARHT